MFKRSLLCAVCSIVLLAPASVSAAVRQTWPSQVPGMMYIAKCHIKAVGGGRAVRRCSVFLVPDPNSREQKAAAWARKQVGKTRQPNGNWWAMWCERFAASAYGRSQGSYVSAKSHYRRLKQRKLVKTKGTPPAGALVFYDSYYGHVAISLGDGRIVTTPGKYGKAVYVAGLGEFKNYLGWSYADPEWVKR